MQEWAGLSIANSWKCFLILGSWCWCQKLLLMVVVVLTTFLTIVVFVVAVYEVSAHMYGFFFHLLLKPLYQFDVVISFKFLSDVFFFNGLGRYEVSEKSFWCRHCFHSNFLLFGNSFPHLFLFIWDTNIGIFWYLFPLNQFGNLLSNFFDKKLIWVIYFGLVVFTTKFDDSFQGGMEEQQFFFGCRSGFKTQQEGNFR